MRKILIILFAALLVGCKATQPIVQTRDSVRVEFRHDSVYVWQHDSIFRDRWRRGDTVFVTVEKWRVQWRDKITEIHDTISTNEVQTVEVKYVPAYYKRVSTGFWILLAIMIVAIGIRAIKLYFRLNGL